MNTPTFAGKLGMGLYFLLLWGVDLGGETEHRERKAWSEVKADGNFVNAETRILLAYHSYVRRCTEFI